MSKITETIKPNRAATVASRKKSIKRAFACQFSQPIFSVQQACKDTTTSFRTKWFCLHAMHTKKANVFTAYNKRLKNNKSNCFLIVIMAGFGENVHKLPPPGMTSLHRVYKMWCSFRHTHGSCNLNQDKCVNMFSSKQILLAPDFAEERRACVQQMCACTTRSWYDLFSLMMLSLLLVKTISKPNEKYK